MPLADSLGADKGTDRTDKPRGVEYLGNNHTRLHLSTTWNVAGFLFGAFM